MHSIAIWPITCIAASHWQSRQKSPAATLSSWKPRSVPPNVEVKQLQWNAKLTEFLNMSNPECLCRWFQGEHKASPLLWTNWLEMHVHHSRGDALCSPCCGL